MQINVNTDHNIISYAALDAQVRSEVESALSLFNDHITRVEVHLSDENSSKHGQEDKRCMMEVRLEGRQPAAVTCYAATVDLAIEGAAEKLAGLVGSTLGRIQDQNRQRTDPPLPEPKSADPS